MTTNNAPSNDIQDAVSKALRRAYNLGQTYWQQVDSEYRSQWKKSDVTAANFNQLVNDTAALLSGHDQPAMPADDVEAAAKTLARCMDYPWEFMQEAGRVTMRENAQRVLDAARRRTEGE